MIVNEKEILRVLNKCVDEISELKEAILLLDNYDMLNEDIVGVLKSLGVMSAGDTKLSYEFNVDGEIFFQDSPVVSWAKKILRDTSSIPEGYIVVCPKCALPLEIYGDEEIVVIDKGKKGLVCLYEKGCPYCNYTKLSVIKEEECNHA